MTQEKITVAVVGCGYWGPNLIRNFNSLPGTTLKWIVDLDKKRLEKMEALYQHAQTSSDYEQVLNDEDVDAVIIAVPVQYHFDLAKAALQAGKHVFIEKPMASSVAECKELNALAAAGNRTLMVGHTFVYSSPVRKIKEIIQSGDLGEVLYMSSRRLNLGLFQKDINVTWDLAPHDLAIMFDILGNQATSVNCVGSRNVSKNVEDITSLTITMENGPLATIQSSWLDPNKIREMTFVGSKRMLVYNDIELFEKIKIYDKGVEASPGYNSFDEFAYAYHNGDMYSPALSMVEPLKVEAQHFIDCIHSGEKPQSSGEEGLQVVQVLEASLRSLEQQGANVKI
ncbi:Gfo/Idh/MocA family protein [Candidatus Venteria ishoeyi]|uniref:Putative oxidoreductase YdgJ n=1 Tax=Candidatus Venteria ishoeyi TaxID=1899563 RepID=A0A1H6F570_9GAMM|nr:Gfo/Idh/MocA family oxidoreductase [Candidatus Venteria ishoeyi]MDM8547725.1 Gfo/Idh/MocA family oxidoreductase [Candidatus Venteria ishoeyi]SEH04419.1 putative oxidoreductase YdgJ [Candidatus Venteria ishoeyi]